VTDPSDTYLAAMRGELAVLNGEITKLDEQIAGQQAERNRLAAQRDELADLIAHTQTFVPDAAAAG
jgi:hypothetical protein